MKKIITLFLLSFFASQCFAVDSKLIELSVNAKNKNGKDLVMSFKEEKRDDKTSLVWVKFTSGASVPSSMFIAKGMYKISKSRNALYWINLKEWQDGDKRYYIVGFSNDNTIDIIKFYGENVDETKNLDFLSTKQFDMLWGNE